MTQNLPGSHVRILIASSHPLFAQGLHSLLQRRPEMDTEVVGMVSTIDEVLDALLNLNPDLVIVDYDDEQVNREEFLARFGLRDRLSQFRRDELETARSGVETERLRLRTLRSEAETLLHPRGLGDFRVLVAKTSRNP